MEKVQLARDMEPQQQQQHNLNHTRTHSHPLLLIPFQNNEPTATTTSTGLTEALNLHFITIPQPQPQPKPDEILIQFHPASEIAEALDNFNFILEQQIQQDQEQQCPSPESSSKFVSPTGAAGGVASTASNKIKNSVADLLALASTSASNAKDEEEEDEHLLIVVDVDGSVIEIQNEGYDAPGAEDEDELTSLPTSTHEEEGEGGYESDRPMVRASMRKLRPIKVKLKPLGEEPQPQQEESSELLNILVINGVVETGGGGSGCSTNINNANNSISDNSVVVDCGSDLEQIIVSSSTPTTSQSSGMTEIASGPLQATGSGANANATTITVIETNPIPSSSSTLAIVRQESLVQTNTTTRNPSQTAPTTTAAAPNPSTTIAAATSTGRRQASNVAGRIRRTSVPVGRWPHRLSSVLALIGCTLSLNGICRFGLLSVNYGANFVVQWVLLSIVLGIPLLTFHMSIGQYLNKGVVGMWKISPVFQGIGVGLLFAQAIIGLYSTVGISWMLIWFRDSFVTRGDQYRWGRCVRELRECDHQNGSNITSELVYTVPDYFNGVVLQRSSPDYPMNQSVYVPNSLKFTVAFNLAVVWMLIFVSLSKGLKSYGKVIHGFVLAPVVAIFVLTFKMVGMVDNTGSLFGQTAWFDFFFNSQTWMVAAREVFFTWGVLGACVMQVTSHNRHATHPLKSDAVIVVLVTTVVLLLSAFIGNCCYSIITSATPSNVNVQFQHYSYVPSSFEREHTYKFLTVNGLNIFNADASEITTAPTSSFIHNSLLMGVRISKGEGKGEPTSSGYQVLRLATELFPTAMAILSPSGLSPFWTVLFYFTLVLFGLAQQLAIWHAVIRGIIAIKEKTLRSWDTTITFFVCAMGFALSLPFCTETGIFVTYFLDFVVGSGWWIMALYLLELVAVFIVRGAPYCGENIVTVLFTGMGRVARVFAPMMSFMWNVLIPVTLMILSIASFKSGNIRELYDWNPSRGYAFWPSWSREVGSLLQLIPLLAIPFVAIIQSCRYLADGGTNNVLERLQQLYRPNTRFFGTLNGDSSARDRTSPRRSEDPPPKYTPPPSYSTATGAKIARFLRNSIRRSMRRITTNSPANLPPPPNYASVILEINAQVTSPSPHPPPPEYLEATGILSQLSSKTKEQYSQTLGSSKGTAEMRSSRRRISSDISPRDIARMLRGRGNVTEPGPSSSSATSGHTSLEQKEHQSKLNCVLKRQLEPRGSSTSDLSVINFNTSRNRNSNDSQLALISDGLSFEIDGRNRGSEMLCFPSLNRYSEA